MAAKNRPKRPSVIDVAVGRNVRLWRLTRGLSQAQLADRVGITFQQLQKYEVGTNRIGTGRLVKLAIILRVPISALFEGTDGAEPARSFLALLHDSRSFRLARAFRHIENSGLRLSLVNLVENIAAAVPQTKRRPR